MSILSTILGVESYGGKNVTQGQIGDINNQTGDLAQGYFQITGATWAQFGGLATGYTQANQAPAAVQEQIAENIPVSRWGPATQAALQAAGYQPQRGETLGQMLTRYGQNPADTVAADGSTFGNGATNSGSSGEDYSGFSGDNYASYDGSSPFGSYGGTSLSGANTSGTFDNLSDDAFSGSGGDAYDNAFGYGSNELPNDTGFAVGNVNASTLAQSLDGAGGNNPLTPAAMTGISSNGNVGTQGSVGSIGAGSGGLNVNLTDESQLAPNVAAAGKSVQAGAATAGQDVETSAGGIAGTAASIANAFQTYSSEAIVVVALVGMGLIFVAFGLSMFKGHIFPASVLRA